MTDFFPNQPGSVRHGQISEQLTSDYAPLSHSNLNSCSSQGEFLSMQSGLKLYEIDASSTGPLARPLAHSLAPLTHSLAPELMGKWFMSLK